MTYLEDYVKDIETRGNTALAESILKTAREVGSQYLSKFTYTGTMTGLLFGNIQSGKTGQTFGVISEAADTGFHYFLLLTTDSNTLQNQTYDRAAADLKDFCVVDENEEQKFLSNMNKRPVLIVVKKNGSILKTWLDRFTHNDSLAGNTLFIIDDEADAASLDTKVNAKGDARSTINDTLGKIRSSAQSSIYLQVTGTPQSLILQTEDSDFRPEFIYYFKPGKAYLGGDYFFKRTEKRPSFIRTIDNQTSAKTAQSVVIRHMVVSAQAFLSGDKVSNCLIHPGVKTTTHKKQRGEIETALSSITYNHKNPEMIQAFKAEYDLMDPKKSPKQSYEAIEARIFKMLEDRAYKILVLNSKSADDSTDYQSGCNFIIGGTNLSRGVTFGGLNTFYYTRSSKAPQADTMWQHNRIFGYDRDPGIATVYITQTLYQLFIDINETNNAIIDNVTHGSLPVISYPDGLKPTRANVLDKSALNILVGGTAHYPNDPECDYDTVNALVSGYPNEGKLTTIGLAQMASILEKFSTEDTFNLQGYIELLKNKKRQLPANGKLLVLRNRHLNRESGALLSEKDWSIVSGAKLEFVLTMVEIDNANVTSKWPGGDLVWVPNIKLPVGNNIYVI